jgi:aryl-alcohol dehydrogenase-like predicted oxidoreductase
MQRRMPGKSNLEVSAIGFGCMGMNSAYSHPADRQEMLRLFRSAIEQGIIFFDTAELYSPFINEDRQQSITALHASGTITNTRVSFRRFS